MDPEPLAPSPAPFVAIVSGLPRSGTSLLMQMLRAGGFPVLTDGVRAPDESNPRGYLEYEPVKALRAGAPWMAQAAGKAVKVIHLLLHDLPQGSSYRVVFMDRRIEEVVASQRAMLAREGKPGAKLADAQLAAVFAGQVGKATALLESTPQRFSLLRVPHAGLIREPLPWAERVAAFLGAALDTQAMAGVVDPRLYRQRTG